MLNCQQFKDSKSEETELSTLKNQQLDIYDNKKR